MIVVKHKCYICKKDGKIKFCNRWLCAECATKILAEWDC